MGGYSRQEAMRIHAILLKEAARLRPEPHINHRDITRKEALSVISEKELDYLVKASEIINGIMFERRTRAGARYCL